VEAVVFDLFGTLVDAPTRIDRAHASERLAEAAGCRPSQAERYLVNTWFVRHGGALPTVTELAEHLLWSVGGAHGAVTAVADQLHALARSRLIPDASVMRTLADLRDQGLLLGALSDASAEIAEGWSDSQLAAVVDAAVFSCQAGCVKPDQRLYRRVCAELGVPSNRVMYVGDGGGDELRGANEAGMAAVAVRRRGPRGALAFGDTEWSGPILAAVEQVRAHLAELR